MNKNELEYGKARLAAQKFDSVISAVCQIVKYISFLIAIWLFFAGLAKVVTGQNPDSLLAIAKIVDAFKIGSVAGYIWGLGATAVCILERRGKKRAIREKKRFQQIVEGSDVYRSSSGLTDTGETPSYEGA